MLTILINAYACGPNRGSEPGMAWNWCTHLAKYCELHIITEGEFRNDIEEALPKLEQGGNMHFYYLPVDEKVRKMCWNQGDWRFYYYYKKWQKRALTLAKEILSYTKIDIIHQLNMIGFREPGYLWETSKEHDIPFVWGPVDAKDEFPLAYSQDAGIRTLAFLQMKNAITKWQLKYSRRVHTAAKQTSALLSASSNSVLSFKKYLGIESLLMNETGSNVNKPNISRESNTTTFDILWVGKIDFRKQLNLALGAIAVLSNINIRLHIVGGGNISKYKKEAFRLGICNKIVWHGAIPHKDVQRMMQQCHILLFTSVAEGTPHAVLEAISNGLPVICHDTCGQGDCITSNVGVKIPVRTPSESVRLFAKTIEDLFNHPEKLRKMSSNCFEHALTLSWDSKAQQMVKIYKDAIASFETKKHR